MLLSVGTLNQIYPYKTESFEHR